MSLRENMIGREGAAGVDHAMRLGLKVWAVQRRFHGRPDERPESVLVFARNRSDALRKAESPARLGEGAAHSEYRVARVVSGPDEPVEWPLDESTPWAGIR